MTTNKHMPDEIRKQHIVGELYVVETPRGYVLTDGYETDWLTEVNRPPIKFQSDGTWLLTQAQADAVANFIDGSTP